MRTPRTRYPAPAPVPLKSPLSYYLTHNPHHTKCVPSRFNFYNLRYFGAVLWLSFFGGHVSMQQMNYKCNPYRFYIWNKPSMC